MKKMFRAAEIVLACSAVYYFLWKRGRRKGTRFFRKTGQFLAGPIWIVGYDTTDGTLSLNSNERGTGDDTTYVQAERGDVVQWHVKGRLQSQIKILDIDSEKGYCNDKDFFATRPERQGNHWRAKINDLDIEKGFLEKYNIKWREVHAVEEHNFDPLIQINPR